MKNYLKILVFIEVLATLVFLLIRLVLHFSNIEVEGDMFDAYLVFLAIVFVCVTLAAMIHPIQEWWFEEEE